jgi:hypothetical protein
MTNHASLIDGPFTNNGLASLADLDGVFALIFLARYRDYVGWIRGADASAPSRLTRLRR